MATIRASWKRTVQVKPYESETLELAVEQDVDITVGGNSLDTADTLVKATAQLDRMLAGAGDALVLERLNLRVTEATSETTEPEPGPKPRAPRRAPTEPSTVVLPMEKVPATSSDEPDEYLFSK
jgi:hypothetical protein